MTTRVTVLNHGPENVQVQTYDVKADGTVITTGSPVLLKPREFTEAYVYQGQRLDIQEIRNG